MKNTTLIETLKNQLEEITKEHREFIKARQTFQLYWIEGYEDEDEALDAIIDDDGSNWDDGENTAYEQGQRDMLQNIIWDIEKENQKCDGVHENVNKIVQCPHCAKDIDTM